MQNNKSFDVDKDKLYEFLIARNKNKKIILFNSVENKYSSLIAQNDNFFQTFQ